MTASSYRADRCAPTPDVFFWMTGGRGRHGGHRRGRGMPGPGFGPGGPMGRGGRRARRGDVRAALLLLLGEEPRNGYQLMQEIEERSEGSWRPSPGSVYPALSQLEDEGLVETAGDGGRRAYTLTDAGRAHVDEHREQMGSPWEEQAAQDGMVDVRHLLGQIGMALRQVVEAGSPDQVEQARKLLVATRRDLYRLLAESDDEESTTPDEA